MLASLKALLIGGAGRHPARDDAAGLTVRRSAVQPASSRGPAPTGEIPRKLLDDPNTYLFDLAPIRAKLKDHWDTLQPSVHRIARRMFMTALDGKATYERFDDVYVIAFDRLSGNQADSAGRRLYEQFEQLLFYGKGEEQLLPERKGGRRTGRRSRRRRGLFGQLWSWVKAPFVGNGLASARETGSAEEPAGSDPSTGAVDSYAKKATSPTGRSAAGEFGRTSSAAKARSPSQRTRSGPRSRGSGEADTERQSPTARNEPLQKLNLLREARVIENAMITDVLNRLKAWSDDMASRNFPPPDLAFIYRSMWNLGTKHLTTYTSVPVCWKNSMAVLHGEDVVPLPRRPEHLLELDIASLENTIEILERFREAGRQLLFMNTVHASTLAHKERFDKYKAVADLIPKAAHQHLIIEIVDIEDYVHRPEAVEMVRQMSRQARAVSVSVRLDDRNFKFWKECGVMAIGANLGGDRRPEAEIIAEMPNFARLAKRHRLISYLRELDKLSTTISAAGAGFEFLEGAAIGSSDDPDNLSLAVFDLEHLYRDQVEFV